jgi:hypothetical protein
LSCKETYNLILYSDILYWDRILISIKGASPSKAQALNGKARPDLDVDDDTTAKSVKAWAWKCLYGGYMAIALLIYHRL